MKTYIPLKKNPEATDLQVNVFYDKGGSRCFSEGCLPNKVVEVDFDKHEDELTEYGCSWKCTLEEI